MAIKAQVGVLFSKNSEALSGKRLLFDTMATNFYIPIIQPFDSNHKALHYVTPQNKLFFSKPYVCIIKKKKKHSKNHFYTTVSQ